ncbi:MAG: caspase family protein [Microcoleaceae cyanobacterium]
MKHHVCITIGINQYQFLQPLSYAQQDAEAVQECLTTTSGFSADKSVLISDTSPHLWGIPTHPERDNILDWIEGVCREQLTPDDTLWFFFSGYGISYDGIDYLLPINGNPSNIEATGIPVQLVYERLKQATADNIIVLLDINRSQGARTGRIVGSELMSLAEEMEIPTILSCRCEDQLSRETSALRHGFFTAALLEALQRGEYKTIQALSQFLSKRLPQLTEQHLRPPQDPVLVVHPPEKAIRMILPEYPSPLAAVSQQNGNAALYTTLEAASNGSQPDISPPEASLTPLKSQSQPAPTAYTAGNSESSSTPPSPPMNSSSSRPSQDTVKEETMSEGSFVKQLVLWSGATALLLLLGVFYTNKPTLLAQKNTQSELVAPTEVVASPETAPPPISETVTSDSEAATTVSETTPTPPDSEANQAVLTQAKAQLKGVSASSFSNAITQIRQIPKSDPAYPQAQQEIERWSQTILDVAEGRSRGDDFQGAIAAAMLVPDANEKMYQQAQLKIQQWDGQRQQLKINQALLKVAQGRVKTGQASSYNDAINEARKIEAGQPGYQAAQTQIDQWSQEILKIAQARAQKNQFETAIQAASLVPEGSSAYDPAQKAIGEWKTK